MPSPSADTKFVLSILKFWSMLNTLKYTHNVLSILKWANLCSKISLLSIPKTLWVYLKNLSLLKTNFVSADGLGKMPSKSILTQENANIKRLNLPTLYAKYVNPTME